MKNDLISRSALTERIVDLLVFEWGYEGIEESVRRIFSEIPAADAGPKWIRVKDRLPETESRCLVVRYDGVTKTSFIDILWFDKGTWWNRIFGGEYAVTHWMPLPELPKEG